MRSGPAEDCLEGIDLAHITEEELGTNICTPRDSGSGPGDPAQR